LRSLHLALGVAAFALFVLTGQYMHWILDHLRGLPDGPRLMYRTSHIYLLWSALLNLVLGSYLRPAGTRRARGAQVVGSLLLLAGPILLTASFFLESNHADLVRPSARLAIQLALAGSALHAFASIGPREVDNPDA
jgi:hypothetical protein